MKIKLGPESSSEITEFFFREEDVVAIEKTAWRIRGREAIQEPEISYIIYLKYSAPVRIGCQEFISKEELEKIENIMHKLENNEI